MHKIEPSRDRRLVMLVGGLALVAALTAAGGIMPAFADTQPGSGILREYPDPIPLPYPNEAEI